MVCDSGTVHFFQRLADLLMQADTPGSAELLVQGLAEKGVRKTVINSTTDLAPFLQHADADRFVQADEELFLLSTRNESKCCEVELAAHDASYRQ